MCVAGVLHDDIWSDVCDKRRMCAVCRVQYVYQMSVVCIHPVHVQHPNGAHTVHMCSPLCDTRMLVVCRTQAAYFPQLYCTLASNSRPSLLGLVQLANACANLFLEACVGG